jgi:hypothetical protein
LKHFHDLVTSGSLGLPAEIVAEKLRGAEMSTKAIIRFSAWVTPALRHKPTVTY